MSHDLFGRPVRPDLFQAVAEFANSKTVYVTDDEILGRNESKRRLLDILARYTTPLDKPDGPGWWWAKFEYMKLPVIVEIQDMLGGGLCVTSAYYSGTPLNYVLENNPSSKWFPIPDPPKA